jgi:hypothetical protein
MREKMANLPPIKRIVKEDFAEYPWAEKLLWPINRFFDSIYGALNRDITFRENVRSQLKTVNFTTESTVSDTFPIRFLPDAEISNTVPPSDIIVTKIGRVDGTALAGGATLEWGLASDGQISINNITNLVASQDYSMRLLVLYEG